MSVQALAQCVLGAFGQFERLERACYHSWIE